MGRNVEILDDTSRVFAETLDSADPLRDYRNRFRIADPELIYVDGNSLGRLPIGVAAMLWVALRRSDLMQGYAYPRALAMAGLLAWFITLYLGWASLGKLAPLLY